MIEDEESDSGQQSDFWEHDSPESPKSSHNDELGQPTSLAIATAALPSQKRRRVTRACDECRRKKIKCDGKSLCSHCLIYTYECTYDKPSNRRRNPAPHYVEALENRMQLTETLLRRYMPDVDLNDPDLEPAVQQEFRKRASARAKAVKAAGGDKAIARARQIAYDVDSSGAKNSAVAVNDATMASPTLAADPLESANSDDCHQDLKLALDPLGQLELDDGGWDYHGTSSGAVFMSYMMRHFGGRLGQPPWLPRPQTCPLFPSSHSSPAQFASSPANLALHIDLPPKELALSLCAFALGHGAIQVRILHQPSFYQKVDDLYDALPKSGQSKEDIRFIGLMYAVMALGCVYDNLNDSDESATWQVARDDGMKWYDLSETVLTHIHDCRDTTSLQALVFRVLFLQSCTSMSSVYSLLGVAVRCALRMGLHRNADHVSLSPIEREVRRRLFWAIRQLDIYVSALQGLPILLCEQDIDQLMPTETDDGNITTMGITPQQDGQATAMQPFNAMTNLMEILSKVARNVYPMPNTKDCIRPVQEGGCRVGYGELKLVEVELAKWQEELPEAWKSGFDGPLEFVRICHQLRFTYAHVQLVLYRPFLACSLPQSGLKRQANDLSYACAAAGINVSRNIIHLGSEIRRQGILSGAFWYMLYTEFFAAVVLVFYVLENPEKAGSAEVLADARCARQNVATLTRKSRAAETVIEALNRLFDQLSTNLDLTRGAASSRKRSAPVASIPTPARSTSPSPLQHRHSMGSRQQVSTSPRALSRRSTEASRSLRPTVARSRQSSSSSYIAPKADLHLSGMSSARVTPEPMIGTPASIHALPYNQSRFVSPNRQAGTGQSTRVPGNSLQKVNSLMFPTADPFAYPNQPMMELGYLQGQDLNGTGLHGEPATNMEQQLCMANNAFNGLDSGYFGGISLDQDASHDSHHITHARLPAPDDGNSAMFNTSALLDMHMNGGQYHYAKQGAIHGQQQHAQLSAMGSDSIVLDVEQHWQGMWYSGM